MHAVVRGERLLGVKAPPPGLPPAGSPVVVAQSGKPQVAVDVAQKSSDQEEAESGGTPSESDNHHRKYPGTSTFNATFSALIMLSLFMNIPM
jgi:hypothetical protein